MDSRASENTVPVRRSKRLTSALSVEPTPRGPLKRTRRGLENRAPVAAVNGSRDEESSPGDEDEESPSKKSRLETGGEVGGAGDEDKMDVQVTGEELEKDEDQKMDIGQYSSHGTRQERMHQGGLGDVKLCPHVVLGERCQPSSRVGNEVKKAPTKSDKQLTSPGTRCDVQIRPAVTKSDVQSRSPVKRQDEHVRSLVTKHDLPSPKITSMEEYKKAMEAKIGKPTDNHIPRVLPGSEKSFTVKHRNNIPKQKDTIQHKKQGIKKTADQKRSSSHSSGGFMWYFWRLVLPLLFSSSAVFLAYKMIPVLRKTAAGGEPPSRDVKPEKFADQLSLLETRFPSQRPELWKRSKIHLERHLTAAQPTEPVSLIFTSGLKAERTLRCLARGLAASYSSALNTSVLHIDGASKASQNSDEVKLDIDSQLQAAFEGDQPVAVIHRFEELPPGSTLIFYRYCDHENAAYKRVFLLFTVLLPQDEVMVEQSLKEVEEMVQDYVEERLVGSNSQTAFNMMDADKYGGLWSRISHLILPVVSEKEVEQKGC